MNLLFASRTGDDQKADRAALHEALLAVAGAAAVLAIPWLLALFLARPPDQSHPQSYAAVNHYFRTVQVWSMIGVLVGGMVAASLMNRRVALLRGAAAAGVFIMVYTTAASALPRTASWQPAAILPAVAGLLWTCLPDETARGRTGIRAVGVLAAWLAVSALCAASVGPVTVRTALAALLAVGALVVAARIVRRHARQPDW